jgi:hypothetical protein
MIQQYKADYNGIQIYVDFLNFNDVCEDGFMIKSDK